MTKNCEELEIEGKRVSERERERLKEKMNS
jgi:hypothetical protein